MSLGGKAEAAAWELVAQELCETTSALREALRSASTEALEEALAKRQEHFEALLALCAGPLPAAARLALSEAARENDGLLALAKAALDAVQGELGQIRRARSVASGTREPATVARFLSERA